MWVHAALAAALTVCLLALQLRIEGALRRKTLSIDTRLLSITLLKGVRGREQQQQQQHVGHKFINTKLWSPALHRVTTLDVDTRMSLGGITRMSLGGIESTH